LDRLFEVPGPVMVLECPRGGSGYVGTEGGEVFEIEAGGREARPFHALEPTSGPEPRLMDILRDSQGLVWAATTQGLFLQSDSGGFSLYRPGRPGTGLPDQEVTRFLSDSEGGLWIGTWNGLARVHPRSRVIRRIPTRYDTLPGVSGFGVISFGDAGQDGLFLGTMMGGVDLLEPTWRQGRPVLERPPALEEWPQARVYGFAEGPDGSTWIATLRNSILWLSPEHSVARVVPVVDMHGRGRLDALVNSVFTDRFGVTWAGTQHAGLTRYDPGDSAFHEYRGPDGSWSFGSNYVWPITEDSSGRLWIGAMNGGVSAISASRDKIRFFEAGPGELSDNRVYSIFADSGGFIWIGTGGGGLNRLDPETGEVRVYSTNDGLPHQTVSGIIEDDQGFLWLSTNSGLARLDPGSGEFWVLKEASGLSGNRFFVNSVHKTGDGCLLFGGPDGVTIIDPERVLPGTVPPRVSLTNLQIHGGDVPLSRALGTDGLDVLPEENFFGFQFAALDFADPSQNRYLYMLEGLDDDWIEAGPGHLANYTAVRPGRYTFRVMARNADGVWNRNGLSIPVLVRSPFYQTWWFLSLSALALLSLATWLTYGRIKENRRRLELAARLHDGIGANIASIIRASERIDPQAEAGERRMAELDRVKSLARRAQMEMRAAVRILRKGREGERLDDMMQELRDTVEWMLHDNVRYRLQAPEEVPKKTVDWKVRTDICLLMNEALNNVLKHAEASFVEIELRYEAPDLYFRVTDDGKGFDQGDEGGGNGLGLMREHSVRHGGGNPVRSEPGKGTTVETRIRIP
jgi:signal transduction histidine kinase